MKGGTSQQTLKKSIESEGNTLKMWTPSNWKTYNKWINVSINMTYQG